MSDHIDWERRESRLARNADYDSYRDHDREDDMRDAQLDERRYGRG
ncbi:hypothetical protein [Mycolicibacterium mucogenicum]|uniref:Uncharacterized protein n=1 Tax=Mycolicibacterium mucogenicum DSM 44124 TaxID=1226753 RepID=A0A8E4R9F4_MYCMU|nr:hypothetical protein [Mycolicibacterium mucogenicum]KAB7761791.1 hypothetical protein MMUC44124_01175 [Mycolicibacterium mucogenicum DSM 44124]QPG70037.1 hypothetical protein C1S78_003145 [Mycolicibacterium mucogenicum DSM 44124]